MRSLLPTRARFGRLPFLLLAALLSLGLARPAAATHLLGGEARYRFLDLTGTTPGRPARYEITFSIYYNCENDSNFPCGRSLLGISIFDKVTGVRIEDLNNPTDLELPDNCLGTNTTSQAAAGTFPFFRTSDSTITSPPPPGCSISAGCAIVVTYTAIVELPLALDPNGGYHVMYSDNARNNSVTNIAAAGGGGNSPQVLELDIPSTFTEFNNASPIFSDVPVPLICAGDTVTIINNAFDAEGDRLVYNFYAPYGDPAPGQLNNTPAYLAPSPVNYNTGFSFNQPFGAGGYAAINPITGESQYLVPNQGDYVVGVQVSEFRVINGSDVLLSTINREIQLKVRQCPNNTPPSLQFASGQTTLIIEEGQTGTFITNAAVAAGNSITLTATSPLLDGPGGFDATFNGLVGTAPNVPIVVNGTTSLAGNFVFNSACDSAGVYNVNISARDNDGCPIKSTSIPFLLTVLRPAGPTSITGDPTVCPNITEAYTAVGAPTGTTAIQWTVVGGTIQGSATGPTVSVLWTTVGTGSVSAVAVSALGCLSDPLALSVEIFSGVTAILGGLNPSYCLDPTAPGTTLTGSPAGGTFSITGPGGTTNLVNGVFTPRVAGTFQLTYSVSNSSGCSAVSPLFTVVVNPLPVVLLSSTLPPTVCSNDAPITLAGTVNGTAATTGFTIDGVAATVFNPASLAAGPHVVVLTGTGVGACIDTARRTVTVNAAPTVLLTGLQPSYCQNAPAVPLTATANGGPITGANAVFTIDAIAATQLDPATLTVGFHTVRVLGTGLNGCRDTDSIRVEIKALPALAVTSLLPSYCEYDAPVTLAGTVDGNAGGTFTIDGTAATVFNPGTLSVGPHLVVFSGTGVNTCQDTLHRTVTVNPAPVFTLAAFPASVCLNAAPVTISFASTQTGIGAYFMLGGGPPSGTPTAVGTTFSFTLNPATLGVGTFQIVYGLFAASTPTFCGNQDTLTITIRPLPVVVITGLQAAYCRDAAPVTLTGTVDATAGGTFTIDNVAATVLNPAALTLGVHQVVFSGTGSNGCANTDTLRVTINALPAVAFTGLNAAYCAGAPAVPLAGTVNGTTTDGTITFTVNNNPATSFDPATLPVGTYTVVATGTLTLTGCVNRDTLTVVINALPTVAITNLNPAYCANAAAVPLTGTVSGGTGTLTYTINGVTATSFNPAVLGPGTYTVVATGTVTATTCQGTGTQTVVVNSLPVVTFTGLNPAYCQGDALVTLAATATNGATVIFTVNNGTATTFDPSTLAPGTYTIVATGTDPNTCVGTTTQTVLINARPTVTLTGLNPAYCTSAAPVPLTATVTGGAGTTTFTIDGATATTLNPATLSPGPHTVVVTGTVTATGCLNRDTLTVVINALPTVAITNLNPAYCQGDASVTLTGTVSGGGTTTFTVNNVAATTFDPSTLAPGTYTIIATGIATATTCQNTATQTVTINARPTGVLPTGPPSVCPGLTGVPYSLTGAAGQTYQWTVTGGTVASGQGTASITVDFGAANPGAAVSVVTVDAGTSCRSLPATLPVSVNQVLATQTPAGTPSFCVNAGPQTFSIPIPSPGSNYDWVLSPATAGTITTGQGTATITVTFTQPGPIALTVTETSTTMLGNCRGVSAPLNLTVLPAPDPTLTLQSSAPAACATGAPVTFTLGGATGSTYQWTVDGTVQPGTTANTFDFPAVTAGSYVIGAQETNASGCIGPVITTTLTVNAVPVAITIAGPAAICPQDLTQTYSVTGQPGSTFQWTITGGAITGGQGSGTVTVDFDGSANPTLSVTETSAAGCAGPASPIALTLDAAAPSLTLATVDEASPANQIDLNLSGLNAQPGTTLVIQRRQSGSGAFTQVGTVAAPATTFADTNADPAARAYDYRVDLTNACGTVLQSAEHTTVRVEATPTEASGNVTLTWNEYRGEAVTSYEVLRKNASGGYDVVDTVPARTTTFTATGVGREGFNQTFRIRAVLASNALISYSNEAAVTFTNALQGYNIITPNNDGKNDRFVIDNAVLYPNNELVVFNRWGREVFRRKNYDNSWDGGGLTAGTYYYLFTANGQSIKSWLEIVK